MASQKNARHNTSMNYFVQAENFASDSENQIHSDEVAQRYGFQAALVPGVTVYGYLTTPLVQCFGHEWLSHSVAEVRLIKPTYDGDRVRIEMDDNDACVVVSAFNAADEILATLTSTTPNDLPALNNVHLLDGDFNPPQRIEIAWDTVIEQQVLAPWTATLDTEANATYTTQAKDVSPIYADIAHPHFLLSLANTALMNEFIMPTWLHVGSSTRHRVLLRVNDTITIRAVVLEKWRKKGHEFIQLYLTFWRDDEITTDILHTAIFKVAT